MTDSDRTPAANAAPVQRGYLGITSNDSRVGNPVHIMLVFLVLGLPFVWFGFGELDKNCFGRVYDARVVSKQEYGGSKRTTYHIRYQYLEDGVMRESSDAVDFVTYRRIAVDMPGSAPTGKARVGKVLGFYFDEYFQGEFQPHIGIVVALIFGAILSNFIVLYFLVKVLKHASASNQPAA